MVMKQIEGWLGYLLACWNLPMQAPACRPLWYWVMVASLAIGTLLLLWVCWRVVDYRMKLAAAVKAEERRQAIAPPEVMERFKWAGDEGIEPGEVKPSVRPPLGRPE